MVTVFPCFAAFLAWTIKQESDGGVFNVGNGSSATFSVPTTFQSNSVAAEYSGGAVYVGGKVKTPLYIRRAAPTCTYICGELRCGIASGGARV